jgi:predicted transcriptional regulator
VSGEEPAPKAGLPVKKRREEIPASSGPPADAPRNLDSPPDGGTYGVRGFDRTVVVARCRVCDEWHPQSIKPTHLRTHGLTRAEYNARYSPPADGTQEKKVVLYSEENRASGMLDDNDLPLHGNLGVLAYDAACEEIQCHFCGDWYKFLTGSHVETHGITVAQYREIYGISQGTPVAVPEVREKLHDSALRHKSWRRLTPGNNPAAQAGPRGGRRRLEHLRARGWTVEQVLDALKSLQAEMGGIVSAVDLNANRDPAIPSLATVISRLGSWQNACEVLGQPYGGELRRARPRPERWSSESQVIDALCRLEAEAGERLSATRMAEIGKGGKNYTYPSHDDIRRHVGSWGRARRLMDEAQGVPTGPEAIFGRYGELAHDPAKRLVQCHACGCWFRSLGVSHLRLHDLTSEQYKRRFGLPPTVALKSPDSQADQRSAPRHEGNGPHTRSSRASCACDRSSAATSPTPTCERNGAICRGLPVLRPSIAISAPGNAPVSCWGSRTQRERRRPDGRSGRMKICWRRYGDLRTK